MTKDSRIDKFEFTVLIDPIEFVQGNLLFERPATSDLVNQLDAGSGQEIGKDISQLFQQEGRDVNKIQVKARGRRWQVHSSETNKDTPQILEVILENRTLRVYNLNADSEEHQIHCLPRNEDEVLREMQRKTADVISQIEFELKELLPQHTPKVMIRFDKGSVVASGLVILVVGQIGTAVFNSATKALQNELDSFVTLAIQRAFDYFGAQIGNIQVESTNRNASESATSTFNVPVEPSIIGGVNFRSFGLLWATVLLLVFLELLELIDRFFTIGLRVQP